MELLVRGNIGEIHECGYEMRKRVRGQSKVHALHPLQYLRHVLRLRAARGSATAVMQEKYHDKNPVVRFVIGRFFQRLGGVLAELDPNRC